MFLYSLRTKLIVFWVAFAALFIAATHTAFETALEAQFQQLRQTLMAIASTGALQLDAEAHARIPPEAASVGRPEYDALVGQLRAIRNANSAIRYVYTMIPSETPGTWFYIGDADERQPSLPGEPYNASRYPAMLAGLEGPSADPAITLDEWGALLSGYAPIRTRDGRAAGIVGIDMSGELVARTQEALRRWRLTVWLIGLAAAACLAWLSVHWVSRPIGRLVRAAQRIGQGDFDSRVPVRTRDEVGVLAQSFNRMAELLAASLRQLQEHILRTIESLSCAIEAKDRYTRGHSARVQHYAVKIAERLQLPAADVDTIRQFSLLHDVGKIGIREEILTKPGKLTVEEFEEIRRHPDVGYKILAPLRLPKDTLDIVRHHHERMDGHGYPAGFTQERISLPVAVVAVADAFDAMTGHRPYRPTPLTFPEAAEELRRHRGTQFHPDVVEVLVEVLRQEGKLPQEAPA